MQPGRIADHEHRLAATGDRTDVDVLGHDHAGDRRGDRIGLEALARLDAGDDLTPRDAGSEFDVQGHDPARIAGVDLGLALGGDLDTACQRQALTQGRRADPFDRDATGLGGVGCDDRASLIGRIGPAVLLSGMGGGHRHVERVRLGHHARAGQVVVLRREGEAVGLRSRSAEGDGRLHLPRIDRLVLEIGVEAEERFGPVLVNGDLQREIAVAQHTPAMGTALVFAGRDLALGLLCSALAAGRHAYRERQQRGGDDPPRWGETDHERVSRPSRSACAPVSRSRRARSM